MENNNSENQEIIQLLQEQNQTLTEIKQFLIHQEIRARNAAIFRFVLAAIPYLALVIVVWLLYRSVLDYLDTLNHNIDSLKAGFQHMEDSATNLVKSIKDSVLNLNPFK